MVKGQTPIQSAITDLAIVGQTGDEKRRVLFQQKFSLN
jgi:hypothetical protein